MKLISIFLLGFVVLSSCIPKMNKGTVDANGNRHFTNVKNAETYLSSKIPMKKRGEALGLFTGKSLLSGNHAYRHQDGHYFFGPNLSYKHTRSGNQGRRTYFLWHLDQQTGTANFKEYAATYLRYPYRNSVEAEEVRLEIFPKVNARTESMKIEDDGGALVFGGKSYGQAKSLTSMSGHAYKSSEFDDVLRSAYKQKSSIARYESNYDASFLASLTRSLGSVNVGMQEVNKREAARERERRIIAAKRAAAISEAVGSMDLSSSDNSAVPASSEDRGRLRLTAYYGSEINSSKFKTRKERDAHDRRIREQRSISEKRLQASRAAHEAGKAKARAEGKRIAAEARAKSARAKAKLRADKAAAGGGVQVIPD